MHIRAAARLTSPWADFGRLLQAVQRGPLWTVAPIVDQRHCTVHFASIDALVSTERACVWTLGGLLVDARFERLRREAYSTFAPFVDASGMVAFAMPALQISAAKR